MLDIKTIITLILLVILFIYLYISNQYVRNNKQNKNMKVIITKINKDRLNSENNSIVNNLGLNKQFEMFEENIPKEQPVICQTPGNTLFFLFLNLENLTREAFRPIPEWTNDIFCVYRGRKILSLNNNNNTQGEENDYYYPLGDIILIKDYPAYIANYENNLNDLCYQGGKGNNNTNAVVNSNNRTASPSTTSTVVIPPDNNISNYDQPGVHGLRIMVKNGRKPVGFSPQPIAKIEKENGETLWIWEPIAPENYVFLGHVFTVSVSPSMPLIDRCNIRCIPKECVKELSLGNRDILISQDIVLPNRIYLTGNGKYFKGYTVGNNENDINVKSHDLTDICAKFERDSRDLVMNYGFKFESYNREGENNILASHVYQTVKTEFEIKIENILLNNTIFKLNNYTNRPDNALFIIEDKRYNIRSNSVRHNTIDLSLRMKKRALAYDEVRSDEYTAIFNNNKKLFNFSLSIQGVVYHFRLSDDVSSSIDEIASGSSGDSSFDEPIDPRLQEDNSEVKEIMRAGTEFTKQDPFSKDKSFNQFVDVLNLLNMGVSSPETSSNNPASSNSNEESPS